MSAPSKASLLAAVKKLLATPSAAAAVRLNSNTAERAYEAWIFSLLVDAARHASATIKLRGAQSEKPKVLVFRGAPGRMTSKAADYCHAHCKIGNAAFEIHVDVEYEGSSRALHEIDVSIARADECDRVRKHGSMLPRHRAVLGAAECKRYDSALGTGLGRAYVGLLRDFGTSPRVRVFASNGNGRGIERYLASAKFNIDSFFRLSPLAPTTVATFVNVIAHQLRTWAKTQQ